MRLEIRRLHQRFKATSVFVTHDQVEAMTLVDTVVVMSKGEIQQVGSPTDVYRKPTTTFVASFIGSPAMNLMPGRVVGRGMVEIANAGTLAFDAGQFMVGEGDQVEVGVRPEDWALFTSGEGGLAFRREFVEELGATRLVHGSAGAAPIVVAIPSGANDPETRDARLVAKAQAVHLFSSATGRTLRPA